MVKTPLMVKALCDEDFWNSLSERSGKDWTILAVKPKQGKYYFSSSSPGMFTLMMKIWNEPSDTKVLMVLLQSLKIKYKVYNPSCS